MCNDGLLGHPFFSPLAREEDIWWSFYLSIYWSFWLAGFCNGLSKIYGKQQGNQGPTAELFFKSQGPLIMPLLLSNFQGFLMHMFCLGPGLFIVTGGI